VQCQHRELDRLDPRPTAVCLLLELAQVPTIRPPLLSPQPASVLEIDYTLTVLLSQLCYPGSSIFPLGLSPWVSKLLTASSL
jgi:hypothetical protein